MIVEMSPAIEMVRFACSGTESTMDAIRVARAYSGRELILKFEGNYHGFHDHTLWSTYAPVDAYGNRQAHKWTTTCDHEIHDNCLQISRSIRDRNRHALHEWHPW